MISYKRDALERQSLSEVKTGRGSPICERVCKKIVEYSRVASFFSEVNSVLFLSAQLFFGGKSWVIPLIPEEE